MAVCTDIKLLETIPNVGDVLKVTIDNTTEALWFYSYSDSLQYLNQEVIVEYRKDIYKGELKQFIATFVLPTRVSTIDKQDNIKLFVDQVDNYSNLSFNEIAIGETRSGCIVYCISCEFKSSSAAVWQELLIRDKSMHVAKLRLFDYSNKAANFAGSYVMAEMTRSKFGFQSELIIPVNGECPPNPEIEIAENFIKGYFSQDVVAMDYITKFNLLNHLKEHIDYEPGYGLVRLAMELSFVDAMNNISNVVDLQSIGEALLAKRGYLTRESVLSSIVNNTVLAMNFKWPNKEKVLQLLDVPTDDVHERVVMDSIVSMVDKLITVRKGFVEE